MISACDSKRVARLNNCASPETSPSECRTAPKENVRCASPMTMWPLPVACCCRGVETAALLRELPPPSPGSEPQETTKRAQSATALANTYDTTTLQPFSREPFMVIPPNAVASDL